MRVMRVMRVRCVHPELHLESQKLLQPRWLQSCVANLAALFNRYFLEWAGTLFCWSVGTFLVSVLASSTAVQFLGFDCFGSNFLPTSMLTCTFRASVS